MKKLKLTLGVIGLLLLILTFFFGVTFIPINNYRLEKYSNELFSTPLPPNTQLIEIKVDFGSLAGNGDHCDFFSSVALQSDLDETGLLSHYRENYVGKSEIKLFKLDDFKGLKIPMVGTITSVEYQANELVKKANQDEISKTFIIYTYNPDNGYIGGLGDFRCG